MRILYKVSLAILIVMASSFSLSAQSTFFRQIDESSLKASMGKRVIIPQKYHATGIDPTALKTFLWALPHEKDLNYRTAPVLEIPMPDGSLASFHVWESSIQEPALAARFPEIRTFAGQGITDPNASVRFDFTDFGFHAQILSVNGRVYVDPYSRGDLSHYISYYTTDNLRDAGFRCLTQATQSLGQRPEGIEAGPCRGPQLITYRLAVACTGEYAVAVGGTTAPLLHSAIVTSVNRVTGVYQADLAIKLVLVGTNNNVEYLDAGTDPFSGNNNANVLIDESQEVIDDNIGNANYDIGHTFSTGGGGLAGLGVVCKVGQKASGITGSPNPVGDNYDIDYVAHEMGHQFGANHTFNSSMSNCGGGNRHGSTAYEVGSGTSVMAYAGICGPAATTGDNIQAHSDPYFHPVSFDEISTYLSGTGGTCGVVTATGNNIPVITSMNNNGVSIPLNTPFTLTGTATDADGDPLTYDWEEWDLGASTTWNGGNANTTSPLFKPRIPKTTGSRTFPDIAVILAGFPTNPTGSMGGLKGETMPTTARALKFRLEVRDNRSTGGGVVTGGNGCGTFSGVFQINTVATTGPFAVTVPNGGESYSGNTTQTITWNVVGTDAAPISVANVMISLSTDGGLTYPVILLASTANDGSETVTIPNVTTTTARIKVEALGNIFFDISNANFAITAATAGFGLTSPAPITVSCPSPSTANITLATTSVGGYNTPITLTASSLPSGVTASFATNPVIPGNNSVISLGGLNTLAAGTYNIGITGVSGSLTQTTNLTYIVSAGASPVITTQPGDQQVCAGSNAIFNVVVSVAVTGYQWQVSTDGGTIFSDIPGATTATYTVSSVSPAQTNNKYRVVITTPCSAATSAQATLLVQAPPSIASGGQPQSQTLCAGSNATFTVSATGAGAGYQWQLSTDAGSTWNNIPGATAATLVINGVTVAMNGNQVRVIVTGTCSPSITSSAALLNVGVAASITANPVNQVLCVGGNAAFTVTAIGSNLTYQWQISTDGTNFTDIPGQNTNTLAIPGVTATQNGYKYRVVVFSCTPTGITSSVATLTVNTPATLTAPANQAVCIGTNVTFAATGAGTITGYQWQYSSSCTGTFTDISGATTASLVINGVTLNNAGVYRLVVASPCGNVTSACVNLAVNSPVSIAANGQPKDVEECLVSAGTVNAVFAVVATGSGINYQWQVSTDGVNFANIPGATSATLTIANLTAALNGNTYRVILSGTCTASLLSETATLKVNTPVTIGTQPVSMNTCAGSDVSFGTSAFGSSITYQWQVSINSGTFINLTNSATYSGVNTNELTVKNVATVQSNSSFRVVVSGVPCGSVISSVAHLTVNPVPVVVLTLSSYSNVDPYTQTSLSATVSPPGTYSYQWYKNGLLQNNFNSAVIPVTVDNTGDYTVAVTDANGCRSNISNKVTLSDSVSSQLFVYPNPSSGKFQVRYYNSGGGAHTRSLTIYDAHGDEISKKKYNLTGAYAKMDVDLPNPVAGVYFIDLRDTNGKRIATGRVVIK